MSLTHLNKRKTCFSSFLLHGGSLTTLGFWLESWNWSSCYSSFPPLVFVLPESLCVILKQMLLFRRLYSHLFLLPDLFSLSEGTVGATPLTTGPTASMTTGTAVRPRFPPERYNHTLPLPCQPHSHQQDWWSAGLSSPTSLCFTNLTIFFISATVFPLLMRSNWM